MGLDLGKLSATIDIQINDVDSKLNRVKSSLDSVGRKADEVGRKKLDVAPQGKRELDSAAKSADSLGAAVKKASSETKELKVPSGLSSELEAANSAAGRFSTTMGGLKSALSFTLATAGIAGFGAALGKTVSIGNDFTNNLNTLKAVSGATAAEIDKAGAAARKLGNDATIPATSAGDAAAAMAELAKGGFTVDQAMTAANGTLRLAAAAQIDAASAATIQSQALQSFGLDASYAAKATDVLANAANQSSAEITGISQGLQQSGAVAHQFGLSLEDNATALAMFANAGIQGSDAGTLLKTGLLALTDQGKPAREAIMELGLQIYDANGKFVGMRSLMEQLQTASRNMTDEQYQAATATLFGSDAMRLAAIAAEQGVDGWDKMRAAIDKEGAAAEVAAAKTGGLPGALAAVGNSAEEVGLKIYDAFDGPAEQGLRSLADGISKAGDNMQQVPFAVYAAGIAMLAGRFTGFTGSVSAGGAAVASFVSQSNAAHQAALAQGQSVSRLSTYMSQLGQQVPVIGRMNAAYAAGAGPLQGLAAKHSAAAAAARQQATEASGLFRTITAQGGAAANSFAAGMSRMAGAASGFAGGGLSLVKSGVNGLIGALGGPWGLAIGAAGLVLGQLAAEHQRAAEAEQQHKANVDSLTGSLNQLTGATTEATRASMADRAEKEGLLQDAQKAGVSAGLVTDAMMGQADAMAVVQNRASELSRSLLNNTDMGKAMRDVGVTAEQLQSALSGNTEEIKKLNNEATVVPFDKLKAGLSESEQALFKLSGGVSRASNDLQLASEKQDRLNAAMSTAANQTRNSAVAWEQFGAAIVAIPNDKTIQVRADAVTDETRKALEDIGAQVSQPFEGKVTVTFPDGLSAIEMLERMGVQLSELNGHIVVDQGNLPEVQSKLEELGLKVTTLPTGEVVINSNDPEVRDRMIQLGILVSDPKTGTVTISDNAQQVLNNINSLNGHNTSSTHIIREIVQRSGTSLLSPAASLLAGRAHGGTVDSVPSLPRFFHGGYKIRDTGPGTEKTDGFMAVNELGLPMAWLNAGEWVITRDRSDAFNSTLAAINSGSKEQILAALANELPKFAGGGTSDRVIEALSGMNGTPYIFGGWSPAGTDCSGAVSMGVNAALGLPIFDSRCATGNEAAWLENKGFVRGKGGPGDIRVGFMNGGPGGGHTAMQLPDGTYIESGGNTGGGLTIGGPAGPLEGRGFTDFYFLPGTGGEDTDRDYPDHGSENVGSEWSVSGGGGYSPRHGSFKNLATEGPGAYRTAAKVMPGVDMSDRPLGDLVRNHPAAQAVRNHDLAKLAKANGWFDADSVIEQLANLKQPKLDMWLKVSPDTIKAFNELGSARQAHKDAKENIKSAEKAKEKAQKALEEAKKNAGKGDVEYLQKIEHARADVNKARSAKKPDQDRIKRAEEKLQKLLDEQPDKKAKNAEKLAKAEEDLAKAEEDLEQAHNELTQSTSELQHAEEAYQEALRVAPFKAVQSALEILSEGLQGMAEAINALNDVVAKNAALRKDAASAEAASVDAQLAVVSATEASAEAHRKAAKQRWQDNMTVSDAEWDLAMNRRQAAEAVSDASLTASERQRVLADLTRKRNVLEAALAQAQAERAWNQFERDLELASTTAELEHAQELAEIQAARLAIASDAVAESQRGLFGIQASGLSALGKTVTGLGKIVGGIAKFVGGLAAMGAAIAMFPVNPLGAVAAGAAAVPMITGAITDTVAGLSTIRANREEAREEWKKSDWKTKLALGAGAAGIVGGGVAAGTLAANGYGRDDVENALKAGNAIGRLPFDMATANSQAYQEAAEQRKQRRMEELDKKQQEIELRHKREELKRKREAVDQKGILSKLLDNAEQQLAVQKQTEKRANDLQNAGSSGSSSGNLLFQFGGGQYMSPGDLRKRAMDPDSGFAGIGSGALGTSDSSWQLENKTVTMAAENARRLFSNVQIPGITVQAKASVSTAEATQNMAKELESLRKTVDQIATKVGDGGQKIGAVFNGPVNMPNSNKYIDEQAQRVGAALNR